MSIILKIFYTIIIIATLMIGPLTIFAMTNNTLGVIIVASIDGFMILVAFVMLIWFIKEL